MVNGIPVTLATEFRFFPTDEELVSHYLRRKVFNLPLPTNTITDADVYQLNPWDLLGGKQEMYYFSTKQDEIRTGSGCWKTIELDTPILSTQSPHFPEKPQSVVGIKRTRAFCIGYSPVVTDWFMDEYRLPSLESLFSSGNSPQPNSSCQENWVLCRIFLSRRCKHGIVVGTAADPEHPDYQPQGSLGSNAECSSD